MQKNWYAVYTRPHFEKKVASIFVKRGIQHFCPLTYKKIKSFRRSKLIREPLFKSYVFVNITAAEIDLLKKVRGIINIVYWMSEPAIIRQDEIDAIKEFTSDYRNIQLGRMHVDVNDVARFLDGPSYFVEGNVFAVKNKIFKVSLPSLGYVLMARIEDESIFGRETRHKNTLPAIYNRVMNDTVPH